MALHLFRRVGLNSIFVVAAISTIAASSLAEGFRIETKVFTGDDKHKELVSETTTLFLNGAVYDFLEKPEQTAVFRKPTGGKPGQFILLSDEHSVLTKFSTDNVAGAMKKMRTWASHQPNPFLQFAANPEFDESFDNDSGKLELKSKFETYTVETTPAEHPDSLGEYREFLDWYTQLNTLLSSGKMPPEPRLRLNAVLARRKVVPLKVKLMRPGQEPLRAEHEFNWRLSQDDQKRIDDVREAVSTYREVDDKEFLRATKSKEAAH